MQTEPSGNQAAASPQSRSTSPPPVTAKYLTMEFTLSADLLLELAGRVLTEESSGRGGW